MAAMLYQISPISSGCVSLPLVPIMASYQARDIDPVAPAKVFLSPGVAAL